MITCVKGSVEGRKMKNVSRELISELRTAEAEHRDVQAVFQLRLPDDSVVPEPAETERVAREVICRVSKETGAPPKRSNIFAPFGAFVVDASPRFIRRLLRQREIQSARSNQGPGKVAAGS